MQKRAAILTAFNPSVFKGGIETFVLNLKSLLEERNISVDIHFLSPEPSIPVKPFPIKSFAKIAPEFLLNFFMLGRAFSKIERDYDIVISNNFYGLGYYSPEIKSFNIYHSTHAGYADALRGKVSRAEYRNLKYLFGHIGDRLGGRGKSIIAVSGSVRDELERYYGVENVAVVNHGIDTDVYKKKEDIPLLRRKWNIPADTFTGIFAGRWETGKGIDILQEAIERHTDIQWLLAVGSSHCPLANLPNVRVIKDADQEMMRELYSLADFMLFPSYYEGFGFVIVEAMACGLPVICSETGAAKELRKSYEIRKLMLPLTDGTAAMVDRINNCIFLLRDSAEREKTAAEGRAIIGSRYTLDIWKTGMSAALGL